MPGRTVSPRVTNYLASSPAVAARWATYGNLRRVRGARRRWRSGRAASAGPRSASRTTGGADYRQPARIGFGARTFPNRGVTLRAAAADGAPPCPQAGRLPSARCTPTVGLTFGPRGNSSPITAVRPKSCANTSRLRPAGATACGWVLRREDSSLARRETGESQIRPYRGTGSLKSWRHQQMPRPLVPPEPPLRSCPRAYPANSVST